MKRNKPRIFTALVLVLFGSVAVACGGGVELTTEQDSPSATSSQSTPASPSQSTPDGESSPATGGSVEGIPYYQPSTLVSQSTGSTILGTQDPISKVAAFYSHVVDTGGWTVVSRAVTQNGASFTIKKSGKGASIAVGRGTGRWRTAISISTYTSW